DVVAIAIPALKEVDPGTMELFAALLGQRLRQGLRRSVARGKQLPVLLAICCFKSRYFLRNLKLKRVAEQLMHTVLAAPVEWAAWRRAGLERGNHSEHASESALRRPVGQTDASTTSTYSSQLIRS